MQHVSGIGKIGEKVKPFVMSCQCYRLVDEATLELLFTQIGLEQFSLPYLYQLFETEVMTGTTAHLVSRDSEVDTDILWQLTLRIATDLAENCSLFSILTLALLLAEVRYLVYV